MVVKALNQAYGSQAYSNQAYGSQLIGNNHEMWPFFSGEATSKYGLVPAMTSCTPWWWRQPALKTSSRELNQSFIFQEIPTVCCNINNNNNNNNNKVNKRILSNPKMQINN